MADPRAKWHLGVDDQVSRVIRSIDSQITGLTRSFRTLGGFAGFATALAGVNRMIGAVTELAGQLQDASDKLGVSAEALEKLKGAAEQTGASFDSVQTALVFLAKTTGEAVRGSKEAAEAFRLLGLDATRLADLPLDRRLAVVAYQLRQLPVGADRADLAVKVLGRGAADLLPLLGNLDEELAKVNVTLGNEQTKALDDATDRWEAFKRDAIAGTGRVLGDLLLQFDEFQKRASKSVVVQPGGGFVVADTATLGRPASTSSGPTTRGRKRSLSQDETAAILGLPGLKDSQAAIDALRKTTDEVDALLAKQSERMFHTSLQGTRSLEALADAASSWDAELEAQGRILQEIETPIERYRKALEEINRLESEGLLSPDQTAAAKKNAYEELAATAEKTAVVVDDKTTQILRSIKNATEGFASDITDIFFDTTQSIGEMFANLAEQIAKTFLQQAVIQPWLDAIFGLLGGIGGPKEFDMSKIPARRALGGPVSAGSPYFVGESGPELFVPHTSGTVMPNGVGMGGVTVNFQVSSPDPRAAASILMANERTIVAIVNKAMQRAGRMPELAG